MEIREEALIHKEWRSPGTTWTNYELFEKNGYFVIKYLCDPKTLIDDVPVERGTLKWYGNELSNFKHYEKEDQVEGSIARYLHPKYRKIPCDKKQYDYNIFRYCNRIVYSILINNELTK